MKFYPTFRNWILIVILGSGLFLPANAQNFKQIKIADLFKNSGNYEQALDMYLQLYHSGLTNRILTTNIQECYEELKRYPELISFLQELSKKFPNDLDYQVRLGRAYYLAGQQKTAFTLWDQLLKDHAKNIYLYRSLGVNLIQLRLYNRAITVYNMAIQNIEHQNSLYREIAMLYRAQLNYAKALENYLNYFRFFPNQFGYIRSQIIAMSSDTSSIPQMINVLQKYKANKNELIGIHEFLSDLYLRQKNFDRSFDLYFELYRQTGDATYLFKFVNKASENEAYSYAVKALQILVKEVKKFIQKQQFQLELARNYYRWAKQIAKAEGVKKAQKLVKKAAATADEIIKQKPTSPYRWAAYNLKGDIALQFFENTDVAITLYKKALQARIDARSKDRMRLKLAQCYLMKGNLKLASKTLNDVRSSPYQNLAHYQQAEILFYRGSVSRARKAFKKLSKTLSAEDSLTNNVLGQLMLFNKAVNDSAALARYARARLLIRQKKYLKAAKIFEELAQGPSPLSVESGEQAVVLWLKSGKYEHAQELIKSLSSKHPNDINNDRLYFLLALTQEKEKRWQEAFTTYQTLITKYPNSFYLDQARENARKIKETYLKEQVQ